MKQVELDDIRLTVLEGGQGTPLLLVHGFPLDHRMWKHQIAHFRDRYRVIAPDLRGFGGSQVTPGTVTMQQFAVDLNQLLNRMKVDEPVHFCGLSMGGYIAWQFWDRFADRLQSLILCDTRAQADKPEIARGRQMMAQEVEQRGTADVPATLMPKLVCARSREFLPDVVSQLEATIESTDPRGLAAAQRGMAERPDVTDRLAEVEVPSLVICGAEDAITGPLEMRQMAERMPRAQYVEVADAGHMSPLEQPVAVNQAIDAFLSDI